MKVQLWTDALKRALKAKNLTYKDVAKHCQLSEASVKRIFSEGTFTLSRVLEICALLEMPISELSKLAERTTYELQHEYTDEQEAFFSKNPKTLAYFDWLLKLRSPRAIADQFGLTKRQSASFLSQLESLRLIERLPRDRVRFLVSKNVRWKKNGPLRGAFFEKAKNEFLTGPFDGSHELFKFSILDLSEHSQRRLISRLHAVLEEAAREAALDATVKQKTKKVGVFLATREWSFSLLDSPA